MRKYFNPSTMVIYLFSLVGTWNLTIITTQIATNTMTSKNEMINTLSEQYAIIPLLNRTTNIEISITFDR